MGRADDDHLYISGGLSQRQDNDVGSTNRNICTVRALWKWTGLPQEGASNTRVFTLEFHDHVTERLQKTPLLSLEKVSLGHLEIPHEARFPNSQCTD